MQSWIMPVAVTEVCLTILHPSLNTHFKGMCRRCRAFMHSFLRLVQQTLEIDEELCICFLDWQKAFDRVNWTNWIGHILHRNCLIKQVIEGKIKGEMEVTRR
jgi:hypothetical protein